MVNYQNGRIYKIINDINDEIYIGSTCKPLSNRMGLHRSAARTKQVQSKFYARMNELGIQHFRIILIENYPCNSREELNQREDYYIQELKPSLNQRCAIFNEERYTQYQKEYNKEHMYVSQKKYYANHRDKMKEVQRAYQLKHAESLKAKRKIYRERKRLEKQEVKEAENIQ